jgi:pimeloyl-ACP methyl ester carboxylesterase
VSELPHVNGVTHRFVGANGIVFHVAEAGSANDDPVLLLHGWPQHWYEWRHLIPQLAGRHHVLALDLRGFGWSDAPRRGYLKEQMATDVLAVLDALGLDRVKLVGHDWGGWIGFLLCLRAPERVDRYLALGITHPWQTVGGGWRQLPRFWYQQPIIFPGLGYALHRSRLLVRAALRSGVVDSTAFDRPTLDSFADTLADPARARACVQLYRNFALHELLPLIRGRYMRTRLSVPTRLLLGTGDPAISPAVLAGWEDHANEMSAELIPGCGHFIADERPQRVADEARALFA